VLCGVTQVVVVKDGQRGCRVFMRDGSALRQGIYPVQARKPFGSGDAFAGATLWALFDGRDWAEATRFGAAAAALNVRGDACAESMPSRAELLDFMARQPAPATEPTEPSGLLHSPMTPDRQP
jgi:5-dehydro-2-deoxygluconokinase